MPISYRIDAARNLVHTIADGTLTDEDVIGHKLRLAADPAFTPGMLELSDVRAVTQLAVTTAGVRRMVNVDEASGKTPGRLAIVADQSAVFGMARMYQTLGEHGPMRVGVFRTNEEAEKWLEAAEF